MANEATRAVLSDVSAVLKAAPYRSAWLVVSSSDPSPADVAGMLGSLPEGASGWICAASAIRSLEGGGWRRVSPESGDASAPDPAFCATILAGEICLDASSSVHLRRVGPTLRLFRFTELAAETPGATAPGSEAVAVLVKEESFASTERRPGVRRLCYHTFWRAEPDGEPTALIWRPWLSRFAGWEE